MADLTIPDTGHRAAAVGVPPGPDSPVVVVCGSVTRHGLAIDELVALLTLDGYTVWHTVDIGRKATARERKTLRGVHLRKIERGDVVLVANFDGYVGRDTEFEVLHALKLGKTVRLLMPHPAIGHAPGGQYRGRLSQGPRTVAPKPPRCKAVNRVMDLEFPCDLEPHKGDHRWSATGSSPRKDG